MMFIQVEMHLNCRQQILPRVVEAIVLAKVDVVVHVTVNVQDVNAPVLLNVQEVIARGSVLVRAHVVTRAKKLDLIGYYC